MTLRYAATIALSLLAASAHAQEPPAPAAKAVPVVRRPDADAAILLALDDCKAQPPEDRPYLRYIWVTSGDPEEGQSVGHVIAVVSRGSVTRRPQPLGTPERDRLLLLRVDERHHAPTARDLKEFDAAWEELRFDPRLNLLLTPKTVRFARATYGPEFVFARRSRRDGKIVTETVTAEELQKVSVLRIVPRHLDPGPLYELQDLTYSTAPLVTHDYFVARTVASIRDSGLFDGLYDTLYGGLYYDLVGVPNTLDELFDLVGAGGDKKSSAKEILDRLRSDKRVATFRSGVAGKRPRRVDFLPARSGGVFDSERIISVTHDLQRANLDIDSHPLMNLIDIKADAHEVLWTRANGTIGYALFNGKGERQEKAPDSVVKDHTVPAPFYGELQSAISCIACHEAGGHDGWQPVHNSVKKMLAARKDGGPRLDIFDELSSRDRVDVLDRLAGLYTGEPEQLLRKLRNEYAAAVLRATGPWKASKDQTDVAKLAGSKTVGLWRGYFYDDITPRRALSEWGLECTDEQARVLIGRLLRPVVADANPLFVPEDPRLFALVADEPIGRYDFDLVYAFGADRVRRSLAEDPKVLEPNGGGK